MTLYVTLCLLIKLEGGGDVEVGLKMCTDKKENQVFLTCKEIQNGAVAKSYKTNGLLIYTVWGNI
jgi:hypothetical protein